VKGAETRLSGIGGFLLQSKWKIAAILSLSFTMSFMIFIYSPLDIYLHNPVAFVVSWRFFLPSLLLFFLVCFIVISVILLLLLHRSMFAGIIPLLLFAVLVVTARFVFGLFHTAFIYILSVLAAAVVILFLLKKTIKDKTADVVLLLLWGILLSSYIQILFLNGDMTAITGIQTNYDIITFRHLLYLTVWIITAALPLCIWIVLKSRKLEFKYEKVIIFSALIITCMQITGLVTTAASANLPKGFDEDNPGYVSYKATLSLNSEENILIFVLDKLDVKYMREALELFPHIYDQLDGFTFYENNMAEFFSTLPSMTSMMTQHYYREGQTIDEYWEEAWKQHSYIDTLRENGFTTNLYLDYLSTYGSLNNIRSKTDNLREIGGMWVQTTSVFSINIRLSMSRAAPYFLKNTFLENVTPDFGNEFFDFDIPDPRAFQPPIAGAFADIKFYEYILNNEFNSGNDKKVFTLMHMNGAHGRINIPGINLSVEILDTYFTKLKEIGVYDNCTIILLGDHGAGYETHGVPELTGLLIKPKGSRGVLKTDSIYELSNKYLGASVLEIAGITSGLPDITYFDILSGASPQIRYLFNLSDWWASWAEYGTEARMVYYGTYEVRGDASDAGNWVYIESER